MKIAHPALLATLLLAACDGAPAGSPAASATAEKVSARPASSAAASAPASASAQPTASAAAPAASASASAAGPCPEGARKDDDARYCITLPAKPLAVSYEGDKPAQGIREELEIAGDRVVITVGPAPAGKTVAQLKEDAIKRIGASLVDSGDLTGGYWTDLKDKDGQHIVEGVVVGKYIITCMHWVRDEKNLGAARAVCQSLKTF